MAENRISLKSIADFKSNFKFVDIADLSATGTASSSTFLRGDNSWATAGSTSASDLTSGTYTYQITDAHGCIVTTTATVNNGTPAIENFYTNNVSCNGGTNGSVSLVVNNGNPSYTYNWSNGATTESLTELTAGTYTVEITDANGCITNGSYDITEPTAIDLNPTPTADLGNNDGSIDLNITGGTPGYTFEWSNGASNVTELTNLSAGMYIYKVIDQNNCISGGHQQLCRCQPGVRPIF